MFLHLTLSKIVKLMTTRTIDWKMFKIQCARNCCAMLLGNVQLWVWCSLPQKKSLLPILCNTIGQSGNVQNAMCLKRNCNPGGSDITHLSQQWHYTPQRKMIGSALNSHPNTSNHTARCTPLHIAHAHYTVTHHTPLHTTLYTALNSHPHQCTPHTVHCTLQAAS